MNFSDVKQHNPKLYLDGICRSKIPLSDIFPLSPGNPSSPPIIEGILGGPHPPENYSFDYKSSIPIGPGGAYPKPWLSAAQRLQNVSYGSQIGPYARLVKYADNNILIPNTCTSSQKSGKCGSSGGGGIWGRIGVGLGGEGVGFYPQDWYNQSEGTYNSEYWSDYFNLTGNARWQNKKKWWASTSKATILAEATFDPFGTVEVEVAYASPQFDDPEYFKGLDLAVYNDYSLELLTAMVAIAAAVRWL